MGYPMTFQRVVNRNGLGDGDYGAAPMRLRANVNVESREPIPADAFTAVPVENRDATVLDAVQSLSNHRADRVLAFENSMKMLAGDLRRLEQDALDEQGICLHIARRTDIDPEIVAAVLKEFMSY